MSADEIQSIVSGVEEKLGWVFDPEDIENVLEHTIRKAALNHKGEDYIPILFENELRDSVMREVINYMGRKNRCAANAT